MFEYTEEQKAVQMAVRDFAEKELLVGAIDRDESASFPKELVQKMADLGLMAMMVDPKYGGGGMDTVSYVLAIEELAKIDASAAVIASVNNSLVCWGLEEYGTEYQKEKYLKALATGQAVGAFALSEPEAGSDATSQKTIAIDKGDHYVLNGTKNWITNGGRADIYLVIAQTNPELKHKGINVLIVERTSAGFDVGPKENKLGIRASDTHSLHFTDVKVPKENKIGPDGFGFTFAMNTLNGGRIGIAAQALGIAGGSLERSVAYAKVRQSFGKPIVEHQAIGFKLAEMATQLEASRYLVLKAAIDKDKKMPYSNSAAMAKLHASDTAMHNALEAVQIHGGFGYVKEYHVERFMRDAKITQIYEGTSEIQKMVILRNLVK